MSITEPTFAGAPLSLYRQLPRGVTVTFAGAGGQAPIIGLTDPAALLPTQTNNVLPQTMNLQGAPGTNPGTDTFMSTNPLFGPMSEDSPAGGGNPPLGGNTAATMSETQGTGKGKGKGKAKKGGPGGGGPPGLQKHGGLPPGLAKKAEQGKELPAGNPWSQVLQAQGQNGVPGGAAPLDAPRDGTQPLAMNMRPLAQNLQQNTVVQPPRMPDLPQNIMGLPGPTVALSSEPGPILQLGPPFT